jgi:hypothetical protein
MLTFIWHTIILQPIAQANTKEIVIKYPSALDPKMKDKLVHFPLLQVLWAQDQK